MLGIASFSPASHTRPSKAHVLHIPRPECGSQCGQFLSRHLDSLLEGAVAHHLALDLVHAVNDGRVVPARYIATWRGMVSVLVRALERSPSGVTPQRRATTSCTRSMLGVADPLTVLSSPCRILSARASRASSIVTSRF